MTRAYVARKRFEADLIANAVADVLIGSTGAGTPAAAPAPQRERPKQVGNPLATAMSADFLRQRQAK